MYTPLVAVRVPVDTLVDARTVPTVIEPTLRVPALTFVAVRVPNVAELAAMVPADTLVFAVKVPVVSPVENRAVPVTSRRYCGAVVLIPTFPPVVKMLPIVWLLPLAVSVVSMNIDPADTYVSSKFVVVTFTVVRVPATTKLPDKLTLPPVNVVAETTVEVTVEKVPTVALSVPAVTPDVATMFEEVTLVAVKFATVAVEAKALPVLICVLATSEGTVNVPDTATLLALKLLATRFVEV